MPKSKVEISGGSTQMKGSKGVRLGVISGDDGGEVKVKDYNAVLQENQDVDIAVIEADQQEKKPANASNKNSEITEPSLKQMVSQYLGTHVIEKVVVMITFALVVIIFIFTR